MKLLKAEAQRLKWLKSFGCKRLALPHSARQFVCVFACCSFFSFSFLDFKLMTSFVASHFFFSYSFWVTPWCAIESIQLGDQFQQFLILYICMLLLYVRRGFHVGFLHRTFFH